LTTSVFDVQSKYSKLHIPFILILILFIIERSFKIREINVTTSLLFLIPIFFVEFLAFKKKFFHHEKFLFIVRYIELSLAAFLFTFSEYIFFGAIALLLYYILFIEFIGLFDYSDVYYRFISGIFGIIPPIGSICYSTYLRASFNDILFIQLGIYISVIFIVVYNSILYEKCKNQIEEQLFKQNRLLNNVNETNEALKIHQEKVKKANEELGFQKVMLEAAYKRIGDSNIEIMIQNQVLKYISSSLEIDELMNLTTSSLFSELELDVCAIALNPKVIGNKKVLFKIRTSFDREYEEILGKLIENEQFNCYLISDHTYIDNHVVSDKYEFTGKLLIGSLLIAPLIRNYKRIGFIFVGSKKYDNFADNAGFYEAIVAQILIALNNANMYAKMQNMAIHDGLTGVYNRGYLSKVLNSYIEDALHNETPITLALFDIDKFKTINDTYGHLFGDIIIQTIATLANEMAAEKDGIVGRYGGEEFVIVFPGKNLNEAYELIDKLRMNIKQKEIVHNDEKIHVNVSVGITSYPETCKNPHELLNRADWSMYYSKQNGRDRMTVDSDEVRERVLMK
jgi:diguanylate cyclase (GGDEF)-like protein